MGMYKNIFHDFVHFWYIYKDLTFHDGTAAAEDEVHGFYVNEIHKEYKIPSETKKSKLFKSHGSLMIIAWGFFIPGEFAG